MKIGVLTYHRVVNDGSVLQAYCVQKVLSKHFPDARVEIIDYSPRKLWWTENRKLVRKRPPYFKLNALAKMRSMQRFIRDYLLLSTRSCVTDDLQKAVEFVKRQEYDAIFVGSDTVWEARSSKYAPKPPNIYYLPGVNHTKKISFAASADPLQPAFLSDMGLQGAITPCLKDFSYITVRDKMTEAYLLQIDIPAKALHFMPDPTLQYDFSKLVQKPKVNKKKPWAGIAFGAVGNSVAQQLKGRGYDIIDMAKLTLNGRPIPGSSQSVNVRLGIYSMLDFLITDRFHGSIFALKLAGCPVIFAESSKKWPNPNSKGRDLFQRIGIESMVCRYEGHKTPLQIYEGVLDTWKGLESKLTKGLSKLEHLSAKQIVSIKKLLN